MDFKRSDKIWLAATAVIWLGLVCSGMWVIWSYDNQPGAGAHAPRRWPLGSALVPAPDGPTLIFVARPQYPGVRASLDALADVLAQSPKPPKTYVLFLRPASVDAAAEPTDLLRRAAILPHVRVLRDNEGAEARRFGVATSGQTLLYDNGQLIFSGGITGSTGHRGDNPGAAALVALLTRRQADRSRSHVFGCPLFSPPGETVARND